ncbi:hypothetical protein FN846DRAFT_1012402 [Sphaerosporella brunnea]|uniref:Uncharacterized protein n=1 Tax=Sphaerosporella brunnea TaxID=1250544 RepID=A0A5J5EZM0_9PEZI|nr:hypothetical protein FN846DRAFT_1012402 [Sphaerosporella brunnea]
MSEDRATSAPPGFGGIPSSARDSTMSSPFSGAPATPQQSATGHFDMGDDPFTTPSTIGKETPLMGAFRTIVRRPAPYRTTRSGAGHRPASRTTMQAQETPRGSLEGTQSSTEGLTRSQEGGVEGLGEGEAWRTALRADMQQLFTQMEATLKEALQRQAQNYEAALRALEGKVARLEENLTDAVRKGLRAEEVEYERRTKEEAGLRKGAAVTKTATAEREDVVMTGADAEQAEAAKEKGGKGRGASQAKEQVAKKTMRTTVSAPPQVPTKITLAQHSAPAPRPATWAKAASAPKEEREFVVVGKAGRPAHKTTVPATQADMLTRDAGRVLFVRRKDARRPLERELGKFITNVNLFLFQKGLPAEARLRDASISASGSIVAYLLPGGRTEMLAKIEEELVLKARGWDRDIIQLTSAQAWVKIRAHGVPVAAFGPRNHHLTVIRDGILAEMGITLLDAPRWMANRAATDAWAKELQSNKDMDTRCHVVLTMSKADAGKLRGSRVHFCGHSFKASEYVETRPLTLCSDCARWGHGAHQCKNEARFPLDGGNHTRAQHRCAQDGCIAKKQPGRRCGHVRPFCPNCNGPHSADFNGCPAKMKARKHDVEAQKLEIQRRRDRVVGRQAVQDPEQLEQGDEEPESADPAAVTQDPAAVTQDPAAVTQDPAAVTQDGSAGEDSQHTQDIEMEVIPSQATENAPPQC